MERGNYNRSPYFGFFVEPVINQPKTWARASDGGVALTQEGVRFVFAQEIYKLEIHS
jgi:hypothetical protein